MQPRIRTKVATFAFLMTLLAVAPLSWADEPNITAGPGANLDLQALPAGTQMVMRVTVPITKNGNPVDPVSGIIKVYKGNNTTSEDDFYNGGENYWESQINGDPENPTSVTFIIKVTLIYANTEYKLKTTANYVGSGIETFDTVTLKTAP